MKFKIDLAEYGTVCNRAEFYIEADSEEKAREKAKELGQAGQIDTDEMGEWTDYGWTYEIVKIEEVKNVPQIFLRSYDFQLKKELDELRELRLGRSKRANQLKKELDELRELM